MPTLHHELERIVLGTPWLASVLRVVRELGPPEAFVGAGVIRNGVWDALDSAHRGAPLDDVDVVYFERKASPTPWSDRLRGALPEYRWDVTNQAGIHEWQSRQLGRPLPPYASLEAAIASWPETATAIAVRLGPSDSLVAIAPYGLHDLFNLHLRQSPGLNDPDAFRSRVESKRWHERWPSLTVTSASTSRLDEDSRRPARLSSRDVP